MKKLAIIVFCIFIASGLVWYGFWYSNKNTPITTSSEPSEVKNTSFIGFSKLTNSGLRESRLADLVNYLKEYAQQSISPISNITLNTGSVNYESENNISFLVSYDANQYSATANYTESGVLRLRLFDKDNNSVYDSGVIGNDLD